MKRLILENFRCFERFEIEFKPGINLLVGDNASGKTSLLKACKYALATFFAGFSDDNTRWITPQKDDFKQVEVGEISMLEEEPIAIHFNPYYTLRGLGEARLDAEFTLRRNHSKNARTLTLPLGFLKNYTEQLRQHYLSKDGQQYALPLLANFSVEDTHKHSKLSPERFVAYRHKPSFGYYESLEGDGFLRYWEKRLLVLQEKAERHPEVVAVREAVAQALGEEGCGIINDLKIRPNRKIVVAECQDGREVDINLLSDGYQRLLYIVIDLAFRCTVLNYGIFGQAACTETIGTVLVDEIDLHLHPSLQATVLKGLRRTFPRLQFIVSSHAPMVMSSVKSEEEDAVFYLKYSKEAGYCTQEINTYGQDLSTIAEVALNLSPRDREVEEKLRQLFDLIDREDYTTARWNLDDLRSKYGERLPELTRAESLLYMLEGEEENDAKD